MRPAGRYSRRNWTVLPLPTSFRRRCFVPAGFCGSFLPMLWPSCSTNGPLVKPTRISFPSSHVQAPLLAGQPANEPGSAKTTTFFAPWGAGRWVAFPAAGSAASRELPLRVRDCDPTSQSACGFHGHLLVVCLCWCCHRFQLLFPLIWVFIALARISGRVENYRPRDRQSGRCRSRRS